MLRLFVLGFGILVVLLACRQGVTPGPEPDPTPGLPLPIRYLALGDSYTIGHGVPMQGRFPEQLVDSLRAQGLTVASPTVVARTGWTTGDLRQGIQAANLTDSVYGLVTLLIGVNNQYRRMPLAEYEVEFRQLLEQAIAFADGDTERVFVLSIPDYAVTPFGQNSGNPSLISAQIDTFNLANRQITHSLGVTYFDITPISRQAAQNPALLAPDNLHPSAEMYRQWVALMRPTVQFFLKD